MQGICTNEHAGWFRDVRRILDITEVTPGLPLPHVSGTRASFRYTGITHPAEAAEAVAAAETILSYGLCVTFTPRTAPAGDRTLRYILEGFMASGLAVAIVAKAEHMQSEPAPAAREDAPQLASVA